MEWTECPHPHQRVWTGDTHTPGVGGCIGSLRNPAGESPTVRRGVEQGLDSVTTLTDASVNAGRVSQLNQFWAFPLLLCQSNVSWRWDSMDWSEKWPHVQATNKDHHETSIWLFQNLHYQRWYGWEPLRICKYSQIPLVRISEFYNFHFSRSVEIHTNGIWLYIAQQNVCIIWTSKQMYCKLLIQVLVIIISFSG